MSPDVEPVVAVVPEIFWNVHVTLVVGFVVIKTFATAGVNGEVFRSFNAVTLMPGLALKLSRDQTSWLPTYTELIAVLPIRISVMFVPPTAIGIVTS